MKISQIRNAIKYLPTKTSIMLKGTHGIGKTEFVKQLASDMGLNLVIWHASHAADAGDITGLPQMTDVEYIDPETGKTETRKATKFAPPEWMMQDKPCFVLLDEINRGLSIAMNAIMQFTNDGTYDSIKLPEGSRIFACINPEEDGKYDVGQMDAAQIDRFAVYDFTPSVDEWTAWAREKKLNNTVINFIESHQSYLDPYSNAELVQTVQGKDCAKLPSRRSWEKVAHTIDAGLADNAWDGADGIDLLTEILMGIVGVGAAIEFIKYFKNNSNQLDPAKILTMEEFDDETGKKIKAFCKKDQPAAISFVKNCGLWLDEHVSELTNTHANNFMNVLENMTKDARVAVCTDVVFKAIADTKKWAVQVCRLQPKIKEIVRAAKTVVDV